MFKIETCSSTFNVNINVNFNILLEQSNCALVGQIKRLDTVSHPLSATDELKFSYVPQILWAVRRRVGARTRKWNYPLGSVRIGSLRNTYVWRGQG